MRIVHARKNGNSLGINFPRDIVRALGIRRGDAIGLEVSDGKVMMAKLSVEVLQKAMAEQAAEKATT